MEKRVLAISGKSGLYLLISRGRNSLIVETVDEIKKRLPVSLHDKITSLNDVSIYTNSDEVPLMTVFENIKKKEKGTEVSIEPKKASKKELEDFMSEVLPDFDRERVYQNDIRKLISWYNILVKYGYTEFETKAENIEEAPIEKEIPKEMPKAPKETGKVKKTPTKVTKTPVKRATKKG